MNTRLRLFSIACCTLLIPSCGDDPKLIAESQRQKTEIARLKGEIALIEEKLRNLPDDATAELEEAKKQEATQVEEIETLKAEVTELQATKRTLTKEFDLYRAKYQAQ